MDHVIIQTAATAVAKAQMPLPWVSTAVPHIVRNSGHAHLMQSLREYRVDPKRIR